MKLKKLEITGFKSFPDKTCIEFPPGISAVVGPNGCGKSNVVDALRWVMGEQSVKQLRGKAMEDLIFSGTNGKLPLNMAEVSLILDNDNGTAPEELKDFTQIMLSRRLYRSGETAFFLNKQPCRLKDIHNVFLGSGLGAKAYSIIQQGSIGAIIDAGPEERRLFIEEAAGITRYKNRKNEALRKLQSTNQNLLRITDIISEVNRQMDGTRRQARRTERYNRYLDRIRKLDVGLGGYYFDDYTRRIDETDTLLKELQDADLEHTTQIDKLDAAVEEIKYQRSQKSQDIADQKSNKFETQRNIDRMENDLTHLRKDIERLNSERAGLESARIDLEEKNKNILSEIGQVEKQNIIAKEEINKITSALEQERLASQNIENQLTNLNHELETHKTNLMHLVTEEARYKNIYQNVKSNKESLKRRLERIDEEEATSNKKAAELEKKEATAREQMDSYKEAINTLDKQIGVIREQLEEKSKALSSQVKLGQTLELEYNQTRSEYNTLKKMEDNFEWYKDGVKAVMKAHNSERTADSSELSANVIGLVADIIEPEPSFETAVEAALGESLQYILVKDQETGLDYINYLQTHGAGRSGFIPVSSVKQMECDPEKKPDPQKKLLNHVAVKHGFEKITEVLLGHVVTAVDIKEALNMAGGNNALQTVVTQDGDIISHQGIMIGGSKDKLSGILAKKQELKELEYQMTRIDQRLELARRDQKELEADVVNIETSMQKLIEQKNKSVQNEIEAEKALYKATEDLKNARRHLEIVSLEREQLIGEESDLAEEMTKYNQAAAEIENKVKEAQTKVTETSEKIGSVSSAMKSYNQNIVELKLKMTSLNTRLENSNNTLRRLKEFYNDGIKRLEQLSLGIAQKNQNQAAAKQKIIEYERTLSEMYARMEDLEQVLQRDEADYQRIDARLKDNSNIISTIQSKREEALQKIRLLEIEQSQKHIKRENIANRLEEHYHKTLAELRSELDHTSNNVEMSVDEMENKLSRLRKKIDNIGDVNLGALKEYEQLKVRFDFLGEQRDDLVKATDDLHQVIKKINRITKERFLKTFDEVNEKVQEVFPRLFEGGTARLILTEPDKPLETGVEFMIHPPGKKLTRMSLLSGGEKALAAIALIFSLFLIKPTSFCLMDEIDAPLDDVNIFRFNNLLKIIGEKSQIVMVTHNKKSMEFADTLFGITMQKKGISKIVSVNLEPAAG